jgi:hypothetical protein
MTLTGPVPSRNEALRRRGFLPSQQAGFQRFVSTPSGEQSHWGRAKRLAGWET